MILNVLKVMKKGKWMRLHEIRDAIISDCNKYYAETAISARLRDFSSPRLGYIKKTRNNGSKWFYKLERVVNE